MEGILCNIWVYGAVEGGRLTDGYVGIYSRVQKSWRVRGVRGIRAVQCKRVGCSVSDDVTQIISRGHLTPGRQQKQACYSFVTVRYMVTVWHIATAWLLLQSLWLDSVRR